MHIGVSPLKVFARAMPTTRYRARSGPARAHGRSLLQRKI